MISTNLDVSINTLKECTLDMIEKSDEILTLSINSMIKQDMAGCKLAIRKDDEIDAIREYIRDKSIELLALKQPMAKDLRYVYALATMAEDLERIGDYSANIARETRKIGKESYIKELIDIPKMYEECKSMLENLKVALQNEDEKLAHEIALKDNSVDELYKKIQIDCEKHMSDSSDNIGQGIKLILIARHLERIGDHITNICEKIIYIVNGELIDIG